MIVIIAIFASRNPSLKVNDHSYKLIVASSSAQKTKGLGYRRSLPQNQGMLFVFNASARYCFWMKAMRFRLDIIWLNASKRVVYLKPNLSPATYPKNYCPLQPARYVIELNAGQAAKSDVRLGQTLKF
ncbi:MAG: DUF192 domain-containing protein [Candidatus Saccharimonadales bacterium]